MRRCVRGDKQSTLVFVYEHMIVSFWVDTAFIPGMYSMSDLNAIHILFHTILKIILVFLKLFWPSSLRDLGGSLTTALFLIQLCFLLNGQNLRIELQSFGCGPLLVLYHFAA